MPRSSTVLAPPTTKADTAHEHPDSPPRESGFFARRVAPIDAEPNADSLPHHGFVGAERPVRTATVSSRAAMRAASVLLVEQDDYFRSVVCDQLNRDGYRATAVDSLDKARTLLGHAVPAVIVLNVRGEGDRVHAVLDDLTALPAPPAVILTSEQLEGSQLAEERGTAFLAKPHSAKALSRRIWKLLQQRRRDSSPS